MPAELLPYWPVRDSLFVVDDVILMRDRIVLPRTLRNDALQTDIPGYDRIVIPSSLRGEIVNSLHAAHQGVTGMNERAKAGVYWPGITTDIIKMRQSCGSCNRNMPSQPRTPPFAAHIPTTPFEALACDYFHYIGQYYLVAADRLSGWVEVSHVKIGTNNAGSQGLCTALRRLMVTFGVPVEISSDGGPEFISGETQAFFKRWGIRHRLSSVAFPSSNGRAELAVKTAKRLLEDNVGPDGQLDNDSMVRALLTLRNTPDPGCKLSPSQIVLGRQLRDSLPYIDKSVMTYNNPQVQPQWREAWKAKENALRVRYVKTVENLSEHAHPLKPLRHGDQVMLQNQRGRHPKKWDSSGVVVETKPNDQYVVKISGSGRLTLRNRRFLRLFSPHRLVHFEGEPQPFITTSHTPTCLPSPTPKSPKPNTESNERILSPPVTPFAPSTPFTTSTPFATSPTPHSPPKSSTPSPSLRESVTHRTTPTRLQFGDFGEQSPAVHQQNTPPLQRYCSRERTQRKMYDADLGSYKDPLPVPEQL